MLHFLCTEEVLSLLLTLSEVLAIILAASRSYGQDQGFTMQGISDKHIDSQFLDVMQYWSADIGTVPSLCEWQDASFSYLWRYLQNLTHPGPSPALFFSVFSNACLASFLQCI